MYSSLNKMAQSRLTTGVTVVVRPNSYHNRCVGGIRIVRLPSESSWRWGINFYWKLDCRRPERGQETRSTRSPSQYGVRPQFGAGAYDMICYVQICAFEVEFKLNYNTQSLTSGGLSPRPLGKPRDRFRQLRCVAYTTTVKLKTATKSK